MEQFTQVAQLDDVLKFFAAEYKVPKGREVFHVETYVDSAKGKVVFILSTKEVQ